MDDLLFCDICGRYLYSDDEYWTCDCGNVFCNGCAIGEGGCPSCQFGGSTYVTHNLIDLPLKRSGNAKILNN